MLSYLANYVAPVDIAWGSALTASAGAAGLWALERTA